jgi:hypothetical protein
MCCLSMIRRLLAKRNVEIEESVAHTVQLQKRTDLW